MSEGTGGEGRKCTENSTARLSNLDLIVEWVSGTLELAKALRSTCCLKKLQSTSTEQEQITERSSTINKNWQLKFCRPATAAVV